MNTFLTTAASGFGIGSAYALVALSYAFIFRTTASFNFAQGQQLALGSLLAYTLYQKAGLPAPLALLITMMIVALVGVLIERVAIWPLARRGDTTLTWLISTLAAAILITGAAERIWGPQPFAVNNYAGPNALHLAGIDVATPYVVIFAVAIATVVAIEIFERTTLWGRAMRAVGDNRQAVELAGVNVLLLGLVAFAIGGAMSGGAGFVLAPAIYAQSDAGFSFALLAFAAVAIGGFASHWGALLGGWLVGLVEALTGTYIGLNYQAIAVFVTLIMVLLIRPEGLMSPRGTRTV